MDPKVDLSEQTRIAREALERIMIKRKQDQDEKK